MDFKTLKGKLVEAKKTVLKQVDKAIDASATSLQKSGMNLKDIESFEKFVEKSTNYINSSGKEVEKYAILLLVDPLTNFYKKALYIYPTLYTKAWTKNIEVKMMPKNIEHFDALKYGVSDFPALLIFKDKKVFKVVASEEKILSIVKDLSLDIEKTIASL